MATVPLPPPTWKPKAILFDLLTALTDSWSLWNTAAGAPTLGHRWRTAYLELTYGCGAYQPYESLVAQSAVQAGLPASSAPAAALLSGWADLQPWPETLAVLRRLRAAGVKLGVVTNCSVELGRSAAGFFPFDVVVTAEEAGFYKPHPRPYRDALAALGVEAEEALFVAGSSSDVPGASAVGMKVVWHNRVGLPRKGDVEPLKEGKTLDEALEGFL